MQSNKEPLLHRYFFWSYLIGFLLVAGIILLNYAVISRYLVVDPNHPLNNRSHISRMINIAGRCATDAQALQITLFQIYNQPDSLEKARLKEKLYYTTATFQKSYIGLQKGDTDFRLDAQYNTEEIKQLFAANEKHYAQIVSAISQVLEADVLSPTQWQRLLQGIQTEVPSFVRYMQSIVFKYDEEATEVIAYWGRIALLLTFASLLLLVLIGLLVFRPVTKTIRQYFAYLQQQKQELEKNNRELRSSEERIRRQAGQLQELNQKLIQTQNELLHANQQKDTLLELLSRELREPLHTMRSITHLLTHFVDKLSADEIGQSARDLEYAIGQVELITENILVWLSLQKNTFEAKLETISFTTEYVDDQVGHLRLAAAAYHVHLDTCISNCTQFMANEQVLKLFLLNLLYFLISESERGSHILLQSAEQDDKAGIHIQTSVASPAIQHQETNLQKPKSQLASSIRQTFSMIYQPMLKKTFGSFHMEYDKQHGITHYRILFPIEAPHSDK